jgi:hypothetical protein
VPAWFTDHHEQYAFKIWGDFMVSGYRSAQPSSMPFRHQGSTIQLIVALPPHARLIKSTLARQV